MIGHIRILIAAALPIVAFALTPNAAMAQSYSGNYPLTVTQSHRANGTYCLTLTDDGSLGFPHSGEASLSGEKVGGNLPYGTFQLIGQILVVTIDQPGDSGQNAGLVFTAPARNGNVGKGVYEQVYGGEEFDSGVLAFGIRGGC
jgi:hypothetical protein